MTTYTDEVNIYNPEAVGEGIDSASQTATNYITSVTNDGIVVADVGNGASSGSITSSTTGWHLGGALEYVRSGVARFWIGLKDAVHDLTPTVIIGKRYVSGASDNESHIELDYHSLQMIDKEGNAYLHVSDLRGTDGKAEIVDEFIGDGTTTTFNLSLVATNTDYTISVSDSSGGTITQTNAAVSFQSAPTSGATITAAYSSESTLAKAYTLGLRKSSGNVGAYSFVEGRDNIASGSNSHAEGRRTTASGSQSHAEGAFTTASNFYSHAEGGSTTASGNTSHAEGGSTTASNFYSHAEGHYTEASGSTSHAEGYNTTASSYYSHAEGSSTTASGNTSHAEGNYTTASSYYSHAEGFRTTASGNTSHAEGCYTEASGDYSHAQNYHTIAASANQTAVGKWNVSNANGAYALIVGNGTDDEARSNGAVIDWLGNYIAQGWAGVIQMFAGEVTQTINYSTGVAIVTGAPAGWLLCDGSAVSRTRYATLYAAIGDTWGAGDGSTTFNLPDLRGRAPIGAGTGSGLTARTLGGKTGAETVKLTSSESGVPAHAHGLNSHTHSLSKHYHKTSNQDGMRVIGYNYGDISTGVGSVRVTAASSGTNYVPRVSNSSVNFSSFTYTDEPHNTNTSGAASGNTANNTAANAANAHNNMQPSAVVNFIIHTGKTS